MSSKSIINFSVFFHEKSSIVDDWSSEELLKDKLMLTLCLGINLNDAILQEEKFISICPRHLQLITFLKLLAS